MFALFRATLAVTLSLWLPLWLLTFAPAASAEPRLALVVANAAYDAGPGDSGLGVLANPVNDGEVIAEALREVGFAVTLVKDIDQRGMKRAIGDFGAALAAAGPEAVGLFYYAGHGVQVAGSNYLVPIGAVLKREADADLEAVDMETVLRQMEFAGARINIIILDACRNNPLARSVRSAKSGLARVDAPIGSFIAYSTAPGDVAQDGAGENSPFAAALAEQIRMRNLSIEDVFRRVRVSVKDATQGQQVPWDSSSLTHGFVFNPADIQPAALAENGGGVQQAEIAYWQSVQNSTDPAAIELYLKRYPDGTYAELARLTLDRLQNGVMVASTSRVTPKPAAEPVQAQAFADADFAALERDLRPSGRTLKSLRESSVLQGLPVTTPYRAELSYDLRNQANKRSEVLTSTARSGAIAHVTREIVDVTPWNNVPDQYRLETREELLTIATLNLSASAEGTETRPGRTAPVFHGGRVSAIGSSEGEFLPVTDGAWLDVAYTWEGLGGEPIEMVMTSKVAEAFSCSDVHAALPGRCHLVNSVARDLGGISRRAFWTMVFIEDWGAFLPWGEFGTEDMIEGKVTVTAISATSEQ